MKYVRGMAVTGLHVNALKAKLAIKEFIWIEIDGCPTDVALVIMRARSG